MSDNADPRAWWKDCEDRASEYRRKEPMSNNNTISIGNCPTCNHFPTQFIDENGKTVCREVIGRKVDHAKMTGSYCVKCGYNYYADFNKPVESVSPPAQEVHIGFDLATGPEVTVVDGVSLVSLSDYTSKCAELEQTLQKYAHELRTALAELERVKLERDEERSAHERIAEILLPLVGTADGTSVSCAKRASSQLVAMREQLKKAVELFTHTNKQYRRFYWEIYKSEPTMDDGLYMRGEKMLQEMAVGGEKQ